MCDLPEHTVHGTTGMSTETTSPIRGHRLTSSFTDSAIDVELTTDTAQSDDDSHVSGIASSSADATLSLHQRVARIADLLTKESTRRELSQEDCAAANKHLDCLEQLLNSGPSTDNKADETDLLTATSIEVTSEPHSKQPERRTGTTTLHRTSHDLTLLLNELSSVNEELHQRYLESRHIHDLFIIKCEGLAQKIIELQDEIHELKSDVLEDTIELEGLRGTVRGLHSWVNRWQRERESRLGSSPAISQSKSKSNSKSKSYWKRKPNPVNKQNGNDDNDNNELNDLDTLVEGVMAWMRGWNDIEEGFLIRAKRRKSRQERSP